MKTLKEVLHELLWQYDRKTGQVADDGGIDRAYVRDLYHGEKDHPSAWACERLAFGIVRRAANTHYDDFVVVANQLLEAAGYAPLPYQRRRAS